MQAISVEKLGSEKVLQLKTVEIPTATESTVVVKVFAAGVNPVDTYIRSGNFSYIPELPYIPGKDGAGIVHEVGSGVSDLEVGQRVFICSMTEKKYGTYSQYALVHKDEVLPLDTCLSFEQGAAIGVAYFTAYRALVIKSKCQKEETVLIHGASGAVGLAAIQIAKTLGLKVVGTAGSAVGLSVVRSMGADFVANHKEDGYLEKILEFTQNAGVNIILEMLANVNLDKDFEVLAPRGRVMIIGSRGDIRIDPRKMMLPELQIVGVGLLGGTKEEWKETSDFIVKGIKDGWVKPVIDRIYPLEKARDAHKDIIHSSGAKGKLVLAIPQE